MEMGPVATALNRVRLLAAQEHYALLGDGVLLDRCTNGLDEAAFTTLVERHGGMVYGVCARILRDSHDAEDACQATFLVLARKAGSVRKHASIASWLHGVARRVSFTLVRERTERQRRERQIPTQSSGTTELNWSEVQMMLDEEIDRLPERLRAPIVLCYLEGKTRDEVASALGLTAGRLHGFLQRGRALLRDRLTKRGVTLSVGFLSVGLSGEVCQALPPLLAIRIVNGVIATLARPVFHTTLATLPTNLLATEVLRTMMYVKIRTVVWWAMGVLATLTLIGGGLLSIGMAQSKNNEVPPASPTKPMEEAKSVPKENPKPRVLQLRDLTDTDYVFRITHLAKHPKVTLPSSAIPDEAYAPTKDEKDRAIRMTDKGKAVAIVVDEKEVVGRLEDQSNKHRQYDLNKGLFAGGRLTLTETKEGIVATYTVFGSGVPVIASYRGMLFNLEPLKRATPGVVFRKQLSVPAENNNDFRYAVLAVSAEQKALLSRNYIISKGENVQSSGLHLWQLAADKPKRTNIGDGTQFGFVPKSTLAFNVSWARGVEFWDTLSHQQVGKALPHELREDSVLSPAVSPDGSVMVTRSKLEQLRFWNVKTRQPITPALAQDSMVGGLEFADDGQWFFSQNYKSHLHVWEPKTGKQVAGPFRHDLVGYKTAYSSKTQQLVTIENSKFSDAPWRSVAVIRGGKEWSEVRRIELAGHIREIHWLGDSHLLVVGDDRLPEGPPPITRGRRLLHVIALAPKQAEVQTLIKDSRWLTNFAIAADGQYVIASPRDGTTSCWKVGTKEPLWTKAGDYEVRCGDGPWVLLIGNKDVYAYSLTDGQELWRHDKGDDVLVQKANVYVFGAKGVDIWHVGGKD